jgi:protein gp37
MSNITSIQWADTTVNPIMGCGGCELFPTPEKVLQAIDAAVSEVGGEISSRAIFKELVQKAFQAIDRALEGHKNVVNTTNIWHLRKQFLDYLGKEQGKVVAAAAEKAIKQSITCYAATLHFSRAQKITKPEYLGHKGHAPIFEAVSRFPGKCMDVARQPDLLGQSNPKTPWKDRLPRLIFVSDMGDALSSKGDFDFLEDDLIPAVTSKQGKRHLWLWLTKRPKLMVKFAERIGGLPENMCAMTTLTVPDEKNLNRLKALKSV